MADSIFSRVFNRVAEFFTGRTPWHELGVTLGIARLFRIRDRLREQNLHDTSKVISTNNPPPLGKPEERHRMSRTVDGTYNDLGHPRMGSVGTRFGRNMPLDKVIPEEAPALLKPSPRTVSLELMTRHAFQPATIVNLLAAPWIQFMVHDWMSHGHNEKANPIEIPLSGDDP